MARRNTYREDEVLETPFDYRHLLRAFVYIKKYLSKMILALALSAIGGITYDTAYRYLNIIVTDTNMDGQLEIAEVNSPGMVAITHNSSANTWSAETTFTNRYMATGSAGITITVNKIVESASGVTLSPEGFEFGLFEGDYLLGETVKTDANGKAEIKLVYNAPDCGKTYTYTLREIPERFETAYLK